MNRLLSQSIRNSKGELIRIRWYWKDWQNGGKIIYAQSEVRREAETEFLEWSKKNVPIKKVETFPHILPKSMENFVGIEPADKKHIKVVVPISEAEAQTMTDLELQDCIFSIIQDWRQHTTESFIEKSETIKAAKKPTTITGNSLQDCFNHWLVATPLSTLRKLAVKRTIDKEKEEATRKDIGKRGSYRETYQFGGTHLDTGIWFSQSQRLYLTFQPTHNTTNLGPYLYQNVRRRLWDGLKNAGSAGKYFHR
jgi:hypothetical protein